MCGLLAIARSRPLEGDALPARALNLAMAVLLTGYEWWLAGAEVPDATLQMPAETRPATKAELLGLYEHLEGELDTCGFLRLAHQRPTMVRNLRNLFGRAQMTEQEVRTFRGIIACLTTAPRRRQTS